MNLTAIVDLQFGSTGKGLLAGYLSLNNEYDAVVSANMPNAGHTFVDETGAKWIHKVLPSGVYSKNLKYIMVGPGAVFDVDRLHKEVEGLLIQGIKAQVIVHETAAVVGAQHKRTEQNTLVGISSTMQGSMEAMYEKMQRKPSLTANIADTHLGRLRDFGVRVVDNPEWVEILSGCKEVLMEGSQGYSLGINAGFYPYCTSRDCTVWRLMGDCAMPFTPLKGTLRVVGSARVHPIRVGSVAGGYSGPCYPDQEELTWELLGQTPETTTVTGRVRRVFSFSESQILEAMAANAVTEVFLNFCNYDPHMAIQIANRINEINNVSERDPFGFQKFDVVRYLGFGPKASDVLKVGAYHG